MLAAFAALWWTNRCLRTWYVPICYVSVVAPSNRLKLDPLSHWWCGCVSTICLSAKAEDADNEKKWEVLGIIKLASRQNGVCSSQHIHYTKHESCWVWLQVAGHSHYPAICNKLVRCCFNVARENFGCMTAEISWSSEIVRVFFDGMDVGRCWPQSIPGILH